MISQTTQDLYIGLDIGRAVLIGGAEDNPARDIRPYDLSPTGQAVLGAPTIQFDGQGAYTNSYFASSVQAFGATGDASQLEIANSSFLKPEQVTSYELGYRGKLGKFIVDMSGYYNQYQDFLANETVIAPFYGDVQLTQTVPGDPNNTPLAIAAIANEDYQIFQTYTNSEEVVNSYGGSVGVSWKF